jgi:hypothetical protein
MFGLNHTHFFKQPLLKLSGNFCTSSCIGDPELPNEDHEPCATTEITAKRYNNGKIGLTER